MTIPATVFVTLNGKQDIRKKASESSLYFYNQPVNTLNFFGQNNITETSRDTVVANKIDHGAGVTVDNSTKPNKIYVVDKGNNRILGFRSLGYCQINKLKECTNDTDCLSGEKCIVDTQKNADMVFGQADFSSGACNRDNNYGIFKQPTNTSLCLGYTVTKDESRMN